MAFFTLTLEISWAWAFDTRSSSTCLLVFRALEVVDSSYLVRRAYDFRLADFDD